MTTPDIHQPGEETIQFSEEELQLLGLYGIPHKDDKDKQETLTIIKEFGLTNGTEGQKEDLIIIKKIKQQARALEADIQEEIDSGEFEYNDSTVDTLAISRTIIGVLLRYGASNPKLDDILIKIFDEDTDNTIGKKSAMNREMALREKVAILGKYLFMLENNSEDDIADLLKNTNNKSIIIVLYLFALSKNMSGIINLLENNEYYKKILAEYQNELN